MENFQSMGLPEALLHSLQTINYTHPTPIQAESIPIALNGSDVLGSAQTGTGKTAAYTIPLIANLLNNSNATALIIAPTRELAFQINTTIKQLLGKNIIIKSAVLIGGDPIKEQIITLKKIKPRIIVGTPGRIVDLLERGDLVLNKISFLVLDETDRMLDMGFSIDLDKIIGTLPETRQTLMFSATISTHIAKLAQKYLLKDAVRITIGSTTAPNDKISQELVQVSNEEDKYPILLTNLNTIEGSVIIFVKTKMSTESLAKRLVRDGYKADVIHGDLRQRQRIRAINDFKKGRSLILVATDIAARGLDIPNIECVLNYDLPQCPEDYIHRIGRTGRAGTTGRAINIISNKDNGRWYDICKMINPNDPNLANFKTSSSKKSKTRNSSSPRPSSNKRFPRGVNSQSPSSFNDSGFRRGPRREEGTTQEGSFRERGRSDKPFFNNNDGGFRRSPRREEGTAQEGSFRERGRSDKPFFNNTESGFKRNPRREEGTAQEGSFRERQPKERFFSNSGNEQGISGRPRREKPFSTSNESNFRERTKSDRFDKDKSGPSKGGKKRSNSLKLSFGSNNKSFGQKRSKVIVTR